ESWPCTCYRHTSCQTAHVLRAQSSAIPNTRSARRNPFSGVTPLSNARQEAIAAVTSYKPNGQALNFRETPSSALFASTVFSDKAKKGRFAKAVYKALASTIRMGEKLDGTLADSVAAAMKEWAIEKGATHYAHVFYPLTGLTAEKHDSFLTPTGDGTALAEFS